jgi:hypothetical protein
MGWDEMGYVDIYIYRAYSTTAIASKGEGLWMCGKVWRWRENRPKT